MGPLHVLCVYTSMTIVHTLTQSGDQIDGAPKQEPTQQATQETTQETTPDPIPEPVPDPAPQAPPPESYPPVQLRKKKRRPIVPVEQRSPEKGEYTCAYVLLYSVKVRSRNWQVVL